MAIVQQLDVAEADRVIVHDLELEDEPVGEVDEILVEDGPPAHDRSKRMLAAATLPGSRRGAKTGAPAPMSW